MSVIGFNFTKLLVEKTSNATGRININNNVSITDVLEVSLPIVTESQIGLKFVFKFNTNFEPEVGVIEILGELLWLSDKNKGTEILKGWKKDKNVSKDVMTIVLNTILSKSNIEALFLCRDMNLPSPIPLPKFRDTVDTENKSTKDELEKSEKKDKLKDSKKK